MQTSCPAFDPTAARLFDFRTAQQDALRFFYLMPYTERHAFIEYTVFASAVAPQSHHDAALRDYIEKTLGISAYDVISRETGAVPITDYPFQRRAGNRIMNIGANGGRIKPSTGYSFMRIQQDSSAIVRSLLEHGHPFAVPEDRWFYRTCDSLLLRVMASRGAAIEGIYTELFKHNPIQRVLRFLDEASTPAETALLIASLPPRYFLRALFQRPWRDADNAIQSAR